MSLQPVLKALGYKSNEDFEAVHNNMFKVSSPWYNHTGMDIVFSDPFLSSLTRATYIRYSNNATGFCVGCNPLSLLKY